MTSAATPSASRVNNPAQKSCITSKYAGNHPRLRHSARYCPAPSRSLGSLAVMRSTSSRACASGTPCASCADGSCSPLRNARSWDRSKSAEPSKKSSPRTHPREKTSAASVTTGLYGAGSSATWPDAPSRNPALPGELASVNSPWGASRNRSGAT